MHDDGNSSLHLPVSHAPSNDDTRISLTLSRLAVTALKRHFQKSSNKGGEALTYLDPSKPRIGEVCTDAYSGVSLFWKQGSGPEASTQPYLKRLQLRSIMPHLRNLFLKGLFLDFLVSHKSAIDRRSSQRTVDLASSQSHFTIEARTVCRLPCSRLKCANGLFTACNLGNRCHVRGEFISH